MTTTAAAIHAPTCLPLPPCPATPEDIYYSAIDTASSAYQDEVAMLTALAAKRWGRAIREARQRYRAECPLTETGKITDERGQI